MCGICGIYAYGGVTDAESDRRDVQAMMDTLRHRGPDGEGLTQHGPATLGHRRLSIVDVAGGAQPLANEDDTVWVTYNGEIYNFSDLRSELERSGHRFRTRTDTEVLVHGYEVWGDDVVSRLNGIFAFGLWDDRNRRLLLGRDPFGVKPLYYHDDGSELVFASELKALFLRRGIVPEVDEVGLTQCLEYGFVPSPLTLFKGVRKLGPGERLLIDREGVVAEDYTEPVRVADPGDREALESKLRRLIEDAVRRQTMSDVPFGALLSGGIDSTVVVDRLRQLDTTVRTFSIGVRDEPAINELKAAQTTAKRLGTEHREVEIGPEDYASFLERAHWYLEEPCTPSALLTFFVCRMAAESVKVVLTGQGADELFGGYARYRGEYLAHRYQYLPQTVTGSLAGLLAHLPVSLRLKRGARALTERDPVRRYQKMYEVLDSDAIDAINPAADVGISDPIERIAGKMRDPDSLNRLLFLDMRCGLADNLLMFGDKMSMAASVEARVPFLDLELVRTVEAIPGRLKLEGGRPKALMKDVVRSWLPESVLDKKKLGFEIPEAKWFQTSLSPFVRESLLSSDGHLASILDRQAVSKLLDDHAAGRQNLWRQIFALLSIEMVYRQFLRGTKP